MKYETSELVFILDRSGSMSGLEKDTIGGFNSLIQKQRKEKQTSRRKILSGKTFQEAVPPSFRLAFLFP